MAFRPNYNQQRNDRNRVKQAKKDERLRRLQEDSAERKAAAGDEPDESPEVPAQA